jgi:tetraacyldisaccharide 4'-kinase
VISIGNLTLGGTGKTPLTMWVARWYQQQGWRVAVLSRGYQARTTAAFQVVSTGDGPLLDWRTAGDEPYLLACSLPGIAVLSGKDRYLSGRYACDYLSAQVVILDDGFQYYALQRDLDVVLLDAGNPFGSGALLPRGMLREPVHALRRADAVMLSRTEMARSTWLTLCQQLRRWQVCHHLYALTTVAEALTAALSQSETRAPASPAWLQQRRVVAFAGIGHPQAFVATLRQLGSDVAAMLIFPDHYPYTADDWRTIVNIACQRQACCLVTTEKDAVRLAPDWQAPMPVYTLRIGVRFIGKDALFQEQLQAVMAEGQPPAS